MRERGRHFHRRHDAGRHLLEPTLLLMVRTGAAHGYDLMEKLEEIGLKDIDASLIYRALHALEAEGLITSVWDEKGSHGPPRRIYSITDSGEEMLAYFIQRLKTSRQQIEHVIAIYENSPGKKSGDKPSK